MLKSFRWRNRLHGLSIQYQESVATRLIPSRLVVLACLGLLLFATTLQAVHTCGSQSSEVHASIEAKAVNTGASPCMVCMLQVAAVILVLTVLSSDLVVRTRAALVQVRPRVLLSSFRLDVRPPPVL